MPRRLSTFQFHSQAHTKHVVLLSASFLNVAHEKKRSKAENDRKNQDIKRFWGKISSFTLTCPSDRPCRPFPYHKLRLADRGVVAIGGFWHSDGSGGGAYRSSFYSLSRLRERGAKSQVREGCHSMGCLRAANTSSTKPPALQTAVASPKWSEARVFVGDSFCLSSVHAVAAHNTVVLINMNRPLSPPLRRKPQFCGAFEKYAVLCWASAFAAVAADAVRGLSGYFCFDYRTLALTGCAHTA